MPDLRRYFDDYGRYRVEYPDQFFERLERLGIGQPGQRVLDLGTGTGILARGFARRQCLTSGLDSSAAMLDKASQLDQASGVAVNYIVAAAEQTGLPAQSFDVVASSMAWFFFERTQAMREAQRLLVPGGALVLAHLHRLALPGSVTEATNRLIDAFQLVCTFRENLSTGY